VDAVDPVMKLPAVARTVRPAEPRRPFRAPLLRACAVLRCPRAAFPIRVSGTTITRPQRIHVSLAFRKRDHPQPDPTKPSVRPSVRWSILKNKSFEGGARGRCGSCACHSIGYIWSFGSQNRGLTL